ncbi:MAG: XTP/dITP diphosphatase [bacterium]|nr:XTP/dITP diphosphatase [bacterium]
MNTLLIATRNQKKQKELEELLAGFDWRVVTLREYSDCPETVEDADTFIGNAVKKAMDASRHTGLLTLADDSGLEVDALDGRPGVYSARYARGEGSTDEENLRKVLEEMESVPESDRGAHFVCAAALAMGEEVVFTTQQRVSGVLLHKPVGKGGFGYDPIFYYPPFGRTFAEIPSEKKHVVSHRGQALQEVKSFLETFQPGG